MGLSATQARYLAVTAKQSDLEYQGQQINQARTTLSEQVSELYNSLLSMEVPTPPSTSDYQTVKYTGKVGTTQYSFDASSVRPESGGTYTIKMGVVAYGHSLDTDSMREVTRQEDGSLKMVGNTMMDLGLSYEEMIAQYEDCKITEEEWENYKTAISNAQLKDDQGNTYTADKFYVTYTTSTDSEGNEIVDTVYFALQKDAGVATEEKSATVQTYTYVPNGQYTEYQEKTGCDIGFDSSTGRITSVTFDVGSGTSTTRQTITTTASTETDEYAYKNAYAQYEYKKYLYDKEQQEINAKTEIIQQEDRNLELKLQRLDTERQEITTELDALKEVLKNNIENSYKTFSG